MEYAWCVCVCVHVSVRARVRVKKGGGLLYQNGRKLTLPSVRIKVTQNMLSLGCQNFNLLNVKVIKVLTLANMYSGDRTF